MDKALLLLSGKASVLRVKEKGSETFLLLPFLPTGGSPLLTASQLAAPLTHRCECDIRPSFSPNGFSTNHFRKHNFVFGFLLYLLASCERNYQESVKMVFGHYRSITEVLSWLRLPQSDRITFHNDVVALLSV